MPPEQRKSNSVYIGDGVYVSDDGYQLWLATGDHKNNVVALDPVAFVSLMQQARRLFGDRAPEVLRREADAIELRYPRQKEEDE